MPELSMREALEGAFDESESEEQEGEEESGGSEQDTKESVGAAEGTDDTETKEDSEEGDGDTEGGDDKDPDVKEPEDKESDDKAGETEEQDTGKSAVKAPASWKPGAREHWGKVPEEAQKEIARREKHMDNMVRESADSRKHLTEFNELMRPFEPLVAAQNSTPMAAIKNLMTTAAGLTLGTPQQKAQVITNIMKQYGVDVEILDQVLSGGMANQQGQIGQQQLDPSIQNAIAQQMAPINQFMGQMNQQRQTYEDGQAQTIEGNITVFADDPAHEFFNDVQMSMADLMEMSANRNEEMTMQQAYDKACRMDDSINTIITGRAAAANAAANKKDIAKKRHAASSISGGNAANLGEPAADTLRGALINAWDDAS